MMDKPLFKDKASSNARAVYTYVLRGCWHPLKNKGRSIAVSARQASPESKEAGPERGPATNRKRDAGTG